MPGNDHPEHARHKVQRLLRGVELPIGVYRDLCALANTMEAGKSELRGHLGERKAKIASLTRDLEQARELQKDDALIGLYKSGSTLLTKQAEEINSLKVELQCVKDEHEKSKLKLEEKNDQIIKVEDEKQNCRVALRRLEDRQAVPAPQAISNEELAKLKQRLQDYHSMVDEQQKHIDKLTRENERLVMALGRQHFNEMNLP